jgi:hypothetical protein
MLFSLEVGSTLDRLHGLLDSVSLESIFPFPIAAAEADSVLHLLSRLAATDASGSKTGLCHGK